MTKRDLWMVDVVRKSAEIKVLGNTVDLKFKDLADGCVGVSLWFESEEAAIEYASDGMTLSQATFEDSDHGKTN